MRRFGLLRFQLLTIAVLGLVCEPLWAGRSFRCEFTDNSKRKVEARVEFDEAELKVKVPVGKLFLLIDGFGLPAFDVEGSDHGGAIQIEKSYIKRVETYFPSIQGPKKAFLGTKPDGKTTVLIELTEAVTGGKEIEANCFDHAAK